ncbi:uncharacterized protein LOC118120113 [Hippoglossus stenolepis]|uniref:uncharacterized protein LOC118120113 n=1 Tax=Hippoglossus stenolepis TaxID=195615 RepID=UPI001FAEFD0F|nr:uncharacterized protein LOC118120113 [Hippoglossus stenolepis]
MFHLTQAALLAVHLVVMCPVLAEILQFFPDDHRDILVSSGDSVTFTCNTTTNRTSQINWTKGKFFFSHSVSLNKTVSNVTSDRVRIDVDFPSKLKISNAQHEDSGLYQCGVTDRKGAWSNRWNLTVAETPPEVLSWYFLYTILRGVVLLLFGITAAVCLHRKLRTRTSNQDPVQSQLHLQSGGEVVIPQAQAGPDRRTNNKHRSQYRERLNSIYGVY